MHAVIAVPPVFVFFSAQVFASLTLSFNPGGPIITETLSSSHPGVPCSQTLSFGPGGPIITETPLSYNPGGPIITETPLSYNPGGLISTAT